MKLLTRICFVLVVFTAVHINAYEMDYYIDLVPEKLKAKVRLEIDNEYNGSRVVKEISFKNYKKLHSNFKANGKLKVTDTRITWEPPKGKAWITLDAHLLHERDPGEYDSYIDKDWALFRGDDLFPSASVVTRKGASSETEMHFRLPKDWPYVNTSWVRDESVDGRHSWHFFVNNPKRDFDRPTGWMIAGKIATRRDMLGKTRVSVSGPQRTDFEEEGAGFKRMEIMTLLHFVWPQIEKLLPEQPPELLIVGAGKPMWRGGLSGPYSLFMHQDRPLISENATSTLLHEVFHSLTRIRGKKNDDWIAEGLAEYYSIMLLYRAGGMAEERLQIAIEDLQSRSKNVKTLRKSRSTNATTAKAVLVFREVDTEIREKSKGKYSLDDVVKELVPIGKVDLQDLQKAAQGFAGKPLGSLANLK